MSHVPAARSLGAATTRPSVQSRNFSPLPCGEKPRRSALLAEPAELAAVRGCRHGRRERCCSAIGARRFRKPGSRGASASCRNLRRRRSGWRQRSPPPRWPILVYPQKPACHCPTKASTHIAITRPCPTAADDYPSDFSSGDRCRCGKIDVLCPPALPQPWGHFGNSFRQCLRQPAITETGVGAGRRWLTPASPPPVTALEGRARDSASARISRAAGQDVSDRRSDFDACFAKVVKGLPQTGRRGTPAGQRDPGVPAHRPSAAVHRGTRMTFISAPSSAPRRHDRARRRWPLRCAALEANLDGRRTRARQTPIEDVLAGRVRKPDHDLRPRRVAPAEGWPPIAEPRLQPPETPLSSSLAAPNARTVWAAAARRLHPRPAAPRPESPSP